MASSLFAAPDPPIDLEYQKDYDLYSLELIEAQPPSGRKYMMGDWGGSRTYLERHGLNFLISYVTDMLSNVHGGRARGFGYTGSFGLSANLDFDKATGYKTGLGFYSSATWRTGTNLSARKIDNQFNVSQLYGFETVLLGELYLKKTLYNGNLLFKAGRLTAGNDFLISPLYALYTNDAFDSNPVSLFYNFPSFTAYPVATWGAYLAIQPIEQLIAKFAIFNANIEILKNKYHGVNFTFASTNGVIWITEWNILINQENGSKKMPGNYKAGFIYQTGRTIHFKEGFSEGDYCWYLLFDQMIYRSGEKNLTPFAALLVAPSGRNLFPFFLSGGLVCQGLFKGRPDDTTNFGIAYGKYSRDLAALHPDLLGLFGNISKNSETILELNHWFQVNNWFTFTPDIQYIVNPKGYGTIPNAFVIGFQAGFIL